MAPRSGVRPLHLVVAVAVLVVVLLALPGLLTPIIAGRLRAEARARDLDLRWSSLKFQLPMHVTVRDLEVVRRPSGAPFPGSHRSRGACSW